MNWDIFLPTPIDFLNHAFQFAAIHDEEPEFLEDVPAEFYNSREAELLSSQSALHPKFDIMLFIRAATILDNAVLDFESTSFTGSELASGIFWIVYPHERGLDKEREHLLTVATGYNSTQLARVLNFLEDYRACRSQDIHQVLSSTSVTTLLQEFKQREEHFRIEDDQTPPILTEEDYDEILRVRAGKYGLVFNSFLDAF